MKENLLYYSTNTKIAYLISENFYRSTHYVWCAPVYNPTKLAAYDLRNRIPVSSSPFKIYMNLQEEVNTGDKHSTKIAQNRIGLKNGAGKMHEKGLIDDNDLARILAMIDKADITDFTPLLYLIPAHLVSDRIIRVDVEDTANPFSSEFQIHDLKGNEFEIIEY